MVLIAIAASLTGFYLLFNTSLRADLRQDKVSLWFQRQPLVSKISGLCVLTASFVLMVVACGLGVGILFGLVMLMTSGSLVILLSPLL